MKLKWTSLLFGLLFGITLSFGALASSPVNINTADVSTLAASLDGIGATKAEAIVEYRKAHGPFEQKSDIMKVKGIGQATFENNKEAIHLQDK